MSAGYRQVGGASRFVNTSKWICRMANDSSERQKHVPDTPTGQPPPSRDPAAEALAERIKELNCLYGISNLFENQDVSLPWIMERAVELIPAAWQYPENACARICLEEESYTSSNFRQTDWCQSAPIVLNGKCVGNVAVFFISRLHPREPTARFSRKRRVF